MLTIILIAIFILVLLYVTNECFNSNIDNNSETEHFTSKKKKKISAVEAAATQKITTASQLVTDTSVMTATDIEINKKLLIFGEESAVTAEQNQSLLNSKLNTFIANENVKLTANTAAQADLQTQINAIKNAVPAAQSANGTPTFSNVTLGSKFKLSGVGDGMGNDEWLRLTGTDGKAQYGGISADKLWAEKNLHAGSIDTPGNVNIAGRVYIRGGASAHNLNTRDAAGKVTITDKNQPMQTHFAWDGDERNYIRGDTVLTGDLSTEGIISAGVRTDTPAINLPNAGIIKAAGRLHVTGDELLYLLNKNGVIIGKEWGGNGNLSVEGNTYSQGAFIRGPIDSLRAADGNDITTSSATDATDCANKCSNVQGTQAALFRKGNNGCWCKSSRNLQGNDADFASSMIYM